VKGSRAPGGGVTVCENEGYLIFNRYAQLVSLPILRFMAIPQQAAIEAAVSTLAGRSATDFIAEVYAMLIAARAVAPETLELYYRIGGP
jgi:hypothetical protein